MFICSYPNGTQDRKKFIILHVESEMFSSVFPLTEKKSEKPAASPGKKPSPCLAGICVYLGRELALSTSALAVAEPEMIDEQK